MTVTDTIDGIPTEHKTKEHLLKAASEYRHQEASEEKSSADLILEMAMKNIVNIFKDQHGFAHAVVDINGHNEVLSIETGKFRRYLSKLFWDRYRKVVNQESVSNATQILQAQAEYESHTRSLSLRVAWQDEAIFYDLTDDLWRSVRISSSGWEIVHNSPMIFTRYKPTPQAEPIGEYEADIFDKFIALMNINDDADKILTKVYIVSLLIPDIPHPILNLFGQKGSAKSMRFTLIKRLIDPSKPELLTLHKDRNEFIQQIAHNWIAYYDNAKHVPDWLSDEACRAATGGGHTKRKLYSDDEDITYEYKHCLGFNGINIALTEEDALDRSILIDVERIPSDKRRKEYDIIAGFDELRPRILGFLFDTLAKAMQIQPVIELSDLPRMADFAVWGEAIARTLGYKPNEFISAYYDNIGKQNIEAIENHPLGNAILKWVNTWGKDENSKDIQEQVHTPKEILGILEIIAQSNGIDTTHRSWPKGNNALSRRLNQIRSNLLEGANIEVTITRQTIGEHPNTALVKVRKISPKCPVSPVKGQTTLDTGGIGDSGDIIPTVGGGRN